MIPNCVYCNDTGEYEHPYNGDLHPCFCAIGEIYRVARELKLLGEQTKKKVVTTGTSTTTYDPNQIVLTVGSTKIIGNIKSIQYDQYSPYMNPNEIRHMIGESFCGLCGEELDLTKVCFDITWGPICVDHDACERNRKRQGFPVTCRWCRESREQHAVAIHRIQDI